MIKTIFLSYCSFDSDIADIIDNSISRQIDDIKIVRYTRDVGYRGSFKEFMKTIETHDFVITIVSDKYLKSRACMFEVGEIIKDHNFQNKILFVVLSNKDRFHYREKVYEPIQAEIYDPIKSYDYILYWENEYKKLQEKINQSNSELARMDAVKILAEIRKIIDFDLRTFITYLADSNALPLSELIDTDFLALVNEINPDLYISQDRKKNEYKENLKPNTINNTIHYERKPQMEITDIKIRKIFDEGPLKAICSVTFNDALAVHDVKIIYAKEKLFLIMPSRKNLDGTYKDIVHPTNSDFRILLESAILAEYIEFLEVRKETLDE